jgi:hypothetical protein
MFAHGKTNKKAWSEETKTWKKKGSYRKKSEAHHRETCKGRASDDRQGTTQIREKTEEIGE